MIDDNTHESIPTKISARYWDGKTETLSEIYDWSEGVGINEGYFLAGEEFLVIQTVDNRYLMVMPGNWIIREPTDVNRYYPCTPEIFETRWASLNGR